MFAAPLPLLVRSDARRPASWLACGLAAAAVASLAATGTGVAAAIACGGWAAAAAAGRPPRGLVPGLVRLDAAWWWERAAWPLVGCLAAAAGRRLWTDDGAAIAVGLAIGVGVMTALAVAAATRGATAADATSLGLVVATAAAAAAANGRSPVEALACAGGAAAGLAVLSWAAWRHGRGWSWPADPPARGGAFAELGMARGGVRSALAMITSLAGMAVWYFLAPAAAAAGTFVALGWFTALAVPAVLLGPAGHVAWRRLVATTAAPAGSRRPVRPAGAAAVASGHAVVLGWPPVVAGLLLAAEGGLDPASVFVWPWLTVAALAVAAALLVALALAASVARIDAETTLAWAAGLVILALVALPQTPPPPQEAPGANPGTPGMKTTPPSMPSKSPRFSAAPRLAW